jgi:beta-hydroxylase
VTPLPATAFKILTGEEWVHFQADGRFKGSPVDRADGFIHLSAADQVEGTLERHFAGQSGLVLAEVDLDALGNAVRWEKSRGGALFPHVYGVLPLTAVAGTTSVS